MDRWCRNDKDALLDDEAYNDLKVYADAGQGGFEIRTYLTVSAAAGGAQGVVHFVSRSPFCQRVARLRRTISPLCSYQRPVAVASTAPMSE